jgi:hypothetical protein
VGDAFSRDVMSSWRQGPKGGDTPRNLQRVTVRALLDRPDPRSMGLHPVVLSLGDELRVSGLASGDRRLEPHELKALVDDGHAIAVDEPLPPDVVGPVCAAWVGLAFARTAEDEDAPELPFDPRRMVRMPLQGYFFLDTPALVFGGLDRWVRRAFAVAVERRSRRLAKLLSATAPARTETRAALFVTGSEKERERELDWWARLERDAGRPKPDRYELLARIDAVGAENLVYWHPPKPELKRLGPWQEVGVAVRCAERLGPAVDPHPADPARSAVARAIEIAREAALRGRPARHADVEAARIALIEQVYHPWQAARVSAHLHPDALHAVESALFGAERAPDDTHLDQALLAMEDGVSEVIYPEIRWMPLPSLWAYLAAPAQRAVFEDVRWLSTWKGEGEGVPPTFFDRDLWPEVPVGWAEHLARFRERIFRPTSDKETSDGG